MVHHKADVGLVDPHTKCWGIRRHINRPLDPRSTLPAGSAICARPAACRVSLALTDGRHDDMRRAAHPILMHAAAVSRHHGGMVTLGKDA